MISALEAAQSTGPIVRPSTFHRLHPSAAYAVAASTRAARQLSSRCGTLPKSTRWPVTRSAVLQPHPAPYAMRRRLPSTSAPTADDMRAFALLGFRPVRRLRAASVFAGTSALVGASTSALSAGLGFAAREGDDARASIRGMWEATWACCDGERPALGDEDRDRSEVSEYVCV